MFYLMFSRRNTRYTNHDVMVGSLFYGLPYEACVIGQASDLTEKAYFSPVPHDPGAYLAQYQVGSEYIYDLSHFPTHLPSRLPIAHFLIDHSSHQAILLAQPKEITRYFPNQIIPYQTFSSITDLFSAVASCLPILDIHTS